jgi:hypothetical protein
MCVADAVGAAHAADAAVTAYRWEDYGYGDYAKQWK